MDEQLALPDGDGCCASCGDGGSCEPRVVQGDITVPEDVPRVVGPAMRTALPAPPPSPAPGGVSSLIQSIPPHLGELQNELLIPTVEFAGLSLEEAAEQVADAVGPFAELIGFSGLAKRTLWGPNRMQVLVGRSTAAIAPVGLWNVYNARTDLEYYVLNDQPCSHPSSSDQCVAGFTIEIRGTGHRIARGKVREIEARVSDLGLGHQLDDILQQHQDEAVEPDPDEEGAEGTIDPGVVEQWETASVGGLWEYQIQFTDSGGFPAGELRYAYESSRWIDLGRREMSTYSVHSGTAEAEVTDGPIQAILDRTGTVYGTEFYEELGVCHAVYGGFGLATLAFGWDAAYRQSTLPDDLQLYIVPGFLSLAGSSDRGWFCRQVCALLPLTIHEESEAWDPTAGCLHDSQSIARWSDDFPWLFG